MRGLESPLSLRFQSLRLFCCDYLSKDRLEPARQKSRVQKCGAFAGRVRWASENTAGWCYRLQSYGVTGLQAAGSSKR
jgi:hypothetical protein